MAKVACTSCKEMKDIKEGFYYGKEIRQTWCKECVKTYTRKWYDDRRDRINKRRFPDD